MGKLSKMCTTLSKEYISFVFKSVRAQLKLTQAGFASRLGVCSSRIWQIENLQKTGKNKPSGSTWLLVQSLYEKQFKDAREQWERAQRDQKAREEKALNKVESSTDRKEERTTNQSADVSIFQQQLATLNQKVGRLSAAVEGVQVRLGKVEDLLRKLCKELGVRQVE